MKIYNVIFVLSICMLSLSLTAQYSKSNFSSWEFGAFLGGSYYQGDLHCRNNEGLGILSQTHLSYGLFAKKNISSNLGIKANLLRGMISGSDLDFIGSTIHESRGFSFSSPITEISGVIEWDILGTRRYRSGVFQMALSPYLIGGFGLQLSNANIDWNKQNSGHILTDINQVSNSHLVLPYGIGFRFYISDKVNLSAELAARKVFSDYLDGISEAANPDVNDWDGFGGISLGLRLGKASDVDGDGVKDVLDKCPDIPGLSKFLGCPDSDGDGVQDKDDNCPFASGPIYLSGCPDSDEDGIIDIVDKCPETAGLLEGCPDSDNDGIADSEDKCPTIAGIISLGGCPDTDGDGLQDSEDRCPNEAGLLKNDGCPFIDSDGDGIQDAKDKCPTIAGDVSESGCPKAKTELILISRKIYYDNASSIIKPGEVSKLNEVFEILQLNRDATIELIAQSDHRGESDFNDNLSRARASSVSEWLFLRGIAKDHVSSKAIGEVPGGGTTNEELQEFRVTLVLVKGFK